MNYVGLDIGGTKCAVTLGRGEGKPEILMRSEFPTKGADWRGVLEKFCEEIRKITFQYDLSAIGISCGGPLDSINGIIQSPPNLIGWDNIPVVSYFSDQFSVPVQLQNDANACAYAEWKYGAGQGLKNMVFLTFGTGLGAGLILDGRLYRGTNDNAGEAGHIRLERSGPQGYGKAGSFEGFCSGQGIARLGKELAFRQMRQGKIPEVVKYAGGADRLTAKILAGFAENGDVFSRKVYRSSGEKLGKGLAVIIDLLNPEAIIMGGVYMRSKDLLYPHMMRVLRKECLPQSLEVCRILPALLGENIGDYAALSIAQSLCV